MSVLIKGMEMPNTCKACVCSNYYERMDMILCDIMDKQLDEKQWKSERHHDCPLIEVPTPHGRLIDADKLANETFYGATSAPYITYRKFVNAPTVIEAEGREE